MSDTRTASQRTGRKVLFLFLGAFGIIVGANMALLYSAIGSWPGLESRNAYVDSLGFQDRREAQVALNWVADVSYQQGDVVLNLRDGAGKAVLLQELVVVVGRATYDREDRIVELSSFQDSYRGGTDLVPGNWQVKVSAVSFEGEKFRQRLSLIVK